VLDSWDRSEANGPPSAPLVPNLWRRGKAFVDQRVIQIQGVQWRFLEIFCNLHFKIFKIKPEQQRSLHNISDAFRQSCCPVPGRIGISSVSPRPLLLLLESGCVSIKHRRRMFLGQRRGVEGVRVFPPLFCTRCPSAFSGSLCSPLLRSFPSAHPLLGLLPTPVPTNNGLHN